ncbi:MAG: thiosulfate sulfurtransferase GlpE [Halioglobus sp.]|nr:thiosulfate sulfurtransferase GlpE [Halioglobus sp.]
MTFHCISIDEAKALLDKGGITIADVRDIDAFLAGNIENAIHIQQDSIEGFLAASDKNKPLLVYCYHGHSSQSAADYFVNQGYEEVYSMDGGYEAWRLKY